MPLTGDDAEPPGKGLLAQGLAYLTADHADDADDADQEEIISIDLRYLRDPRLTALGCEERLTGKGVVAK